MPSSYRMDPVTHEWSPSEDAPDLNDPCLRGWMVALACHRYYVLDTPTWNDNVYDTSVSFVVSEWDRLTAELKGIFMSPKDLKHTGHHVTLTQKQLAKASLIEQLGAPYNSFESQRQAIVLAHQEGRP